MAGLSDDVQHSMRDKLFSGSGSQVSQKMTFSPQIGYSGLKEQNLSIFKSMPGSLDKNEEKYVVFDKCVDQVSEIQHKWLTVLDIHNDSFVTYLGHTITKYDYPYLAS